MDLTAQPITCPLCLAAEEEKLKLKQIERVKYEEFTFALPDLAAHVKQLHSHDTRAVVRSSISSSGLSPYTATQFWQNKSLIASIFDLLFKY